jgi:hypothetical protein
VWLDVCKPVFDLPVLLVGCAVSHCLELWLEFMDAGVAAPEGGLHGWPSTASDAAVVVVSLFDHVDGVERTVGDPGVGGASASAAPRS